jgi:hypothetical protein
VEEEAGDEDEEKEDCTEEEAGDEDGEKEDCVGEGERLDVPLTNEGIEV